MAGSTFNLKEFNPVDKISYIHLQFERIIVGHVVASHLIFILFNSGVSKLI